MQDALAVLVHLYLVQSGDVQIQRTVLLGADAPLLRFDVAGIGAVDGLAIGRGPFAQLLQTLQSHGRQFAIGLGTYVHEQVGTLARGVDEQTDDVGSALVFVVYNLVAPHAVHGLACFQRQTAHLGGMLGKTAGHLAWQVALENLDVLTLERCAMVVVTHKTSRLQLVYEFVLSRQFPVKGYGILFVVPPTVEPDRADIAILGEQFGQLGIHEVIVLLPVGIVTSLAALCACTSHGIIVAHPVDVAIIEVQAYALLATGLGQFLQNVLAVGCGLYDVELALLGVPHGETIVMTGGEADVLGTCCLYGTHPFTCIVPVGIESIRHLGILIAVGHCILQVPFALGKHTVDTPMQEDTQLHVTEFLTRAQIGLGGNILCLCLDARECTQGQKD